MNEELMKNLKSLKTPEELGALLKAAGAEVSADKLKALFDKLSSGSLSDKDLEGAAGGIDEQYLLKQFFQLRKVDHWEEWQTEEIIYVPREHQGRARRPESHSPYQT